MSKKILVTRPEHDRTTYYLSLWSKKVLEKFERANDIMKELEYVLEKIELFIVSV